MQEELTTERLHLRPLREADAERIAGLVNWNVARMLARMPWPYTADMACNWIAQAGELRAEGAEFDYAITLEGEGLIGGCGLQSHADGTNEIGYWIAEPWWNRGYATEAAGTLLEHAIAQFGADTIIADHHADNHASGRVLTKLGFRYTGEESRWCVARQENVHCLTMRLMQAGM